MEINLFVDKNAEDKIYFFKNISDAVKSVTNNQDKVIINIAPGKYYEQVIIEKPNLTLKGTGAKKEDTEIYYDLGAFDIMSNGEKRGTFRTSTMFLGADNLTLSNLTVSNTAGEPKEKGQAIALYADGNNILVENCSLKGRQDTLFTGPLPPKEIQPGGFVGPRQFAPRINGFQHYKDCYICGDVDFIFGSATAFFENCIIESVVHDTDSRDSIQGYVTAGSTPKGQKYGYIFSGCNLIGPDLLDETVYLGRPWRDYAKTVFINCNFGSHIHRDGFHDWNKPLARENVEYLVCNCTKENQPFIPGAPFSKVISKDDLSDYDFEKIANSI